MRSALIFTLLASALTACGGYETFVQSDDSALGRVVVYRNGIAYYERRAMPQDDKIILTVPQNKVDDFLKSLTITDERTGLTIPMSYPTKGASHATDVDMTVQLPKGTDGPVVLTYITDSPAWKPSYRLVIGKDNKVQVQSWAVVDNASGEDWNQVKVGVGASSAMSFRYDLRSVVHVHRETLHGKVTFALAPPTGGAVQGVTRDAGVVLAFDDAELLRPADHPEVLAELDSAEDVSRSDRAPMTKGRPAPADDAKLKGLANRVIASGEVVRIDGTRRQNETPQRATQRAHLLRNRLIALGVAPNRAVVSDNIVTGAPGVQIRLDKPITPTQIDDTPVGESHFESKVPMTVARGTSVMVPVLNTEANGEVVYLYNPDGERGDSRYAFKAIRFKNPTDSTLEAGPVTVYGQARFIGEGMNDSIPPSLTALIPYAQDRQVIVKRSTEEHDAVDRLLNVNRGAFQAEVKHTVSTSYALTNRGQRQKIVFVRHPLTDGWTLGEGHKVFEKQGEAYLFRVEVPAGSTKTIVVEAHTPMIRTVDLRSSVGVDLMGDYLDAHPDNRDFVTAMRTILNMHTDMAKVATRISGLQAKMGAYRNRASELTTQIERLGMAGAGRKLRAHLEAKLREVSGRIQRGTIEAVELQERQMLTRIRFQDAVAELTLDPPTRAADKT